MLFDIKKFAENIFVRCLCQRNIRFRRFLAAVMNI